MTGPETSHLILYKSQQNTSMQFYDRNVSLQFMAIITLWIQHYDNVSMQWICKNEDTQNNFIYWSTEILSHIHQINELLRQLRFDLVKISYVRIEIYVAASKPSNHLQQNPSFHWQMKAHVVSREKNKRHIFTFSELNVQYLR